MIPRLMCEKEGDGWDVCRFNAPVVMAMTVLRLLDTNLQQWLFEQLYEASAPVPKGLTFQSHALWHIVLVSHNLLPCLGLHTIRAPFSRVKFLQKRHIIHLTALPVDRYCILRQRPEVLAVKAFQVPRGENSQKFLEASSGKCCRRVTRSYQVTPHSENGKSSNPSIPRP
jgi:hypothetical protein